jgi:hypothetical protein
MRSIPGLTIAETPVPAPLTEAIKALWRIPPPGPNNLLSDLRFIRLRDTCESLYPRAKSKDALSFALSNALRALGLPAGLAGWTCADERASSAACEDRNRAVR